MLQSWQPPNRASTAYSQAPDVALQDRDARALDFLRSYLWCLYGAVVWSVPRSDDKGQWHLRCSLGSEVFCQTRHSEVDEERGRGEHRLVEEVLRLLPPGDSAVLVITGLS